ncbi:hypothetical protein RHS04_03820 [Rhizoctonia solani]|uniref:Uncharacterized protein n=1 Tax=Rhizoctonia solani TaxID=456999 RepID=A0A8H7ILD6_9AGAM|nr:hypothetical protein RHS04_03820 [Rhizoctonia solani]KAF8761244.1 hypothetical protein RHS01_00147 [Rhizoctonia solani]
MHTECRGMPLHVFLMHTIPQGDESWFGPPTRKPDPRPSVPGLPSLLRSRGGSPTLTGLGPMTDADERAEDKLHIGVSFSSRTSEWMSI